MSAQTVVDPRGMRFAAAVTTLVLAAVVLTENLWLLAVQVVVFAIGAFAGVRRSPYALVFTRLIRPRLGAAGRDRGREAAAVRAAGRPRLRDGRAGRASSPAPRSLGLVATAFALVAAFVNAVFGLCLGCEVYLIGARARARGRPKSRTASTLHPHRLHQQHHPLHHNHGGIRMSRDAVLVDADWVESHLDDAGVVLVEVDEDTSAYDKGHIDGAVKIDWKDDLQDPVRRDFVNKEQFEALLSAARHRQRRHGRAVRRQQQLVRRLRLLVLQALRPRRRRCCSTAAARSGSSTPAS